MPTARPTRSKAWTIPAAYAAAALAAAVVVPRMEHWLWLDVTSAISTSSALTIYSTVAAGTMTLSAIVFSLTFVVVQFSATAYSPRLVLWLAQDPLISHALGIFTATFLYAIAAIAWVDRDGTGSVPLVSAALVILWLLASIAMFIALIKRVALLQVSRMLKFTGDQGRQAIAALDAPAGATPDEDRSRVVLNGSPTQVVKHRGGPRVVQYIDAVALVDAARAAGARIEVAVAVGDTVIESTTLLRVFGTDDLIPNGVLQRAIEVGDQRTFEQDPQYSIRLLVDIAIRALSPAVNDPTTAVQALDEIGDLLMRLGHCHLATAVVRDTAGIVRVVIPRPNWDDFLRLAFEEICAYGATAVQVMRRMHALLNELIAELPAERRQVLEHWRTRLSQSIARHFADPAERLDASTGDRQGLGVSRNQAT